MARYGIAVYDILPNGCLNGVYFNDWGNKTDTGRNEMFNEIARKQIGENRDEICGYYDCLYFVLDNKEEKCDLVIDSKPDYGQYRFQWLDKGTNKIRFEGSGWMTRNNQITVSYR